MNRLIKLAGACLLGACGLSAPRDASAQCGPLGCGVSVGIGGGFLASSYSYTSAWPGAFVTPGYISSFPMATSYAVPARLPFVSRRTIITAPALPVVAPTVNVFDPPLLWPIP